MAGGNTIETLIEVLRLRPYLPVVILSVHSEEQYGIRYLRAGASAYLTKEVAPEELVAALRAVVSGRKYVTPALAAVLVAGVTAAGSQQPHETLSTREYEVFRRLVAGEHPKGIAYTLGLSAKTVSTYHSRILAKMGMQSDAELARYAVEHGLVDGA